jgi:hypothetical protein
LDPGRGVGEIPLGPIDGACTDVDKRLFRFTPPKVIWEVVEGAATAPRFITVAVPPSCTVGEFVLTVEDPRMVNAPWFIK